MQETDQWFITRNFIQVNSTTSDGSGTSTHVLFVNIKPCSFNPGSKDILRVKSLATALCCEMDLNFELLLRYLSVRLPLRFDKAKHQYNLLPVEYRPDAMKFC